MPQFKKFKRHKKNVESINTLYKWHKYLPATVIRLAFPLFVVVFHFWLILFAYDFFYFHGMRAEFASFCCVELHNCS